MGLVSVNPIRRQALAAMTLAAAEHVGGVAVAVREPPDPPTAGSVRPGPDGPSDHYYWMAVMKLLALETAPRPVMLSQPATDCCDEGSRLIPFRK